MELGNTIEGRIEATKNSISYMMLSDTNTQMEDAFALLKTLAIAMRIYDLATRIYVKYYFVHLDMH